MEIENKLKEARLKSGLTQEKVANILKSRKCLILTTGILVLITAIVYLFSACVGGAFHDFCKGVILWILMGIGVACSTTSLFMNVHMVCVFQMRIIIL